MAPLVPALNGGTHLSTASSSPDRVWRSRRRCSAGCRRGASARRFARRQSPDCSRAAAWSAPSPRAAGRWASWSSRWRSSATPRPCRTPSTCVSLRRYCGCFLTCAAQSFLGASDETPALVREYFARRNGSTAAADDDGRPLTAYVKPPAETPAASAPRHPAPQQPAPDAASTAPRRPAAPDATDAAAAPRGRARKAVAAAAAAAASSAPDERSWRGRVVNCLACGCIMDCRGGGDAMRAFVASNACVHCGAPVPPDGEASAAASSASDVAAALAAARLVEFDRTAAQRSTVVDDQGDHRDDVEGDAWLSAADKKARRAALAAAEEAAAAERRRVRVTLDLVGRRVLAADGSEGAAAPAAIDEAELARRAEAARAAADAAEATHAEGGGRAAPAARAFAAALDVERVAMAPCPTAPHTPLFRPRPEANTKTAAAAKKAPPAPRQGAAVPRVQHGPALEQAAGGAS